MRFVSSNRCSGNNVGRVELNLDRLVPSALGKPAGPTEHSYWLAFTRKNSVNLIEEEKLEDLLLIPGSHDEKHPDSRQKGGISENDRSFEPSKE